MICISIAEPTPELCLAALDGIGFAEIRIDAMAADEEDIRRIFSAHRRLIATCRPGDISERKRKAFLLAAVKAGAAYVDIEVDAEEIFKKTIVGAAGSAGCRVIVSSHNFDGTPPREVLKKVVDTCFVSGADIAKIACRVLSERDNARLLGLLDDPRPLVVIGLGKKGAKTRVMAPLLGGAFTYASRVKGRETAEGQITFDSLAALIRKVDGI
jgi:3-dehydroquinate dehydratase-1